jgi:hypothetical protein
MKVMETTENKYEKRHFCGGRRHRTGWIALGIVGFTAFAFLFGAVIMWLWNWLMPAIFHLGIITYWQAIGLAILSRLLFGSFHHAGKYHRGRHNFGTWKKKYHMNYGAACGDYPNSVKWSYYDQFWNDEGEKAFNEYLKRKSDNPVKE